MKKTLKNEVFAYIKEMYGTEPEYLWARYPGYAVFRHSDNNKWFCAVMNVERAKLGISGDGITDIINIKTGDALLTDMLLREEGFFPAYHMSRGKWLSVLLDGTVPLKRICALIDTGFSATASAQKKKLSRPPKEWIIPANPKYYDIVHAFDSTDTIEWKQGSGIRKGDTVYMYIGAPISAVMYRCKVTETDIPCDYRGKDLTITKLMRIELQKRYSPDIFTFKVLNDSFGIFAVRGPRGIPNSLSIALNMNGEN